MLAARSGPAYKLARPFHGPFWVIATDANVVRVRHVDHPRAAILRVLKFRVRRCPPEAPDTCWPGKASPALPTVNTPDSSEEDNVGTKLQSPTEGVVRLKTSVDSPRPHRLKVSDTPKAKVVLPYV